MACFRPLDAWQTESGKVVFIETADNLRRLTLPCGQCIGCRLDRSRQWACRVLHEASMYDFNSFVTLTYSDVYLPKDLSLHYVDFQKFMRRLRKRFGSVRFYMCGEYGEKFLRPHFHACLFGLRFPDLDLFSESGGIRLYTSGELNRLWSHGHCSVGDVTFESAAYTARYVCDKLNGQAAEWISDRTGLRHYERCDRVSGEIWSVVPEFTHMSLKPGIAADWLRLYWPEVLRAGTVVCRGVEQKAPRYYDNYLDSLRSWTDVSYARFERALACVDDSSPARLAVREHVARARVKSFKRAVE
jgi:hypothetical protein